MLAVTNRRMWMKIPACDDTIVALATLPGPGAVGIIRISGPRAWSITAELLTPEGGRTEAPPHARCVRQERLRLSGLSSPVPVYVYYWPYGSSYTGEELVELHTIASPPVLEITVEALVAAGGRLARPGEFTLRAFLAGNMDLTQAEAVLGVVNAADERSLNRALRQLAGGLHGPFRMLRAALVDLVSLLEAGLDFPEEEDVRPLSQEELLRRLEEIRTEIEKVRAQLVGRHTAETDWRVVLIGPPNVGKSSLFNALLGRKEALVFNQPGTTRDYLTAAWLVDGIPVTLIDCPGLEDWTCLASPALSAGEGSPGTVRRGLPHFGQHPLHQSADSSVMWTSASQTLFSPDREAQIQAREQLAEAQIQVLCIDCSQPLPSPLLQRGMQLTGVVLALTKADLNWHPQVEEFLRSYTEGAPLVITSSLSGQGVAELRQVIADLVRDHSSGADVVPETAVRCAAALQEAAAAIEQAITLASNHEGEELVAAEVRVALRAIGTITGEVYTEEILDQIFSRFCIGK